MMKINTDNNDENMKIDVIKSKIVVATTRHKVQ